jgi:hypothetical protein
VLYNYQLTPLGITSITVPTPYAVSGTCPITGGTLPASSSCTISVTVTPPSVGALPAGSLTIKTDAPNTPNTASLSGTAVAPTWLSSSSISFAAVAGEASAPKTVVLYNYQLTPLGITSITVPTPYAVSGTCPITGGTLPPSSSCTILVTVTPPSVGALPADLLTINTDAPNTPNTASLSGTAIAPVTLSPSSAGFGSFAVGATSTAKTFTLTNNQSIALSITSTLFGGPFVLDTSAVTTCPVSGGVVSGSLAANSSCVIGVDFQPTAVGPAAGGQIKVIYNASNSPQVAALAGTGIAAVAVSPGTLAFGNVQTGTTSAPKTVTVTNNQPNTLTIGSLAVTPGTPYAIDPSSTCLSSAVASGASCTVVLTFTPTSLGAAPTSALTITDDAALGSPQTVNLTGAGVGQVTLSPTSLAFGTVDVNNAVTKNVTVTNNLGISLTISTITGFPAAYTQSNVANSCTPGLVVASGGNCVIAVTLTATAAGAQPGTISVNDDAPTSPQKFTVSANAIAAVVVLSPTSLSFAAQQVGTTSSPAKTVNLNNGQTVALNISGATITGPNSSDFNVTTTCPLFPASLAVGGNCPLQVTFTPGASGTRTATLNVNDDAPGTPQTITLTGSGSAPVTVLPGLLTFTSPVGSTSAYQNVTITNASTGSVLFTGLLLSGDFIQTSTDCGALPFTLAPGGHCKVSLSFNPSIGGTRDGQLQVYDTAPTSPQVINLTGAGTWPLTLSPSSLSYSAQTVNTSSPAKIITLTNHETESETFTLGTTGDFTATSNCGTGTMPIAANSSCLVYVTFTPSSASPSTRNGTLTITDSAPGNVFCPVAAVTGALCPFSLTGSAVATKLPAAVSVVAPGAGSAGTSVPVVITGNGWTNFSPSSVISFTDVNSGTYPVDITVTSQTFKSINEIDATLTIPANCPKPVTLPCTVEHEVTYGARNIAVTTTGVPLSGGGTGTEVAQLEQAFIIADPNNQHPITVVAPAFGTQGEQSLNVNLTATGTNFDQATTYANFGDGITVNSLTVTDATDAQANITISNTTPVGGRTITLVTGGEFAVSVTNAFQIGPNNATLTGFTLATYTAATSTSPATYTCTAMPVIVPQGFSGALCMTATGTHFLQDATQVSITGGVLVGDVTVTSPTTAIVQVAVQSSATVGLQNATVWTGGETATLNNAVAVTGATPLLVSVVPSSAPQGSSPTVLITGNSYMNFLAGPVSAYFDGNISSPTVNVIDAQHISIPITISPNANVGSITANLSVGPVGSNVLYPFTFTVTQSSAAITSVSPSCVPQGGQLTLTVGAINTNWVQGTTTAAFYPVPVPAPSFDLINITDATDAQLAIAVPTNTPAGSYEFYMATGGQIVNASVNVCAATPTLTMSPSNGLRPFGAAVNSFTANFTGQFTHFGPTTEAVISGEGVTLTSFATVDRPQRHRDGDDHFGRQWHTHGPWPAQDHLHHRRRDRQDLLQRDSDPGGDHQRFALSRAAKHHDERGDCRPEHALYAADHGSIRAADHREQRYREHRHRPDCQYHHQLQRQRYTPDSSRMAERIHQQRGRNWLYNGRRPATTTSGAGTGAVVSITASATGALTSCTATAGGSGYQVGDYIYPTQAGSAGSACQVTAVDGTTAVTTMITVQEQVITGFLVDSPAMPSLVSVCVTGTGPYSTSTVPCVSSAQQGATVQVTITGSLTNWDSTTEAILGAGVTVANLTNTGPTTETATIAVSPTAPVGGNSVIMFTGSQILSGTGFNVTPGASLIYSVGPVGCNANGINEIADVCGVSNGAGTPYVITQLQTATLNIVGVGTHWLQGETTASFGAGVATDSLTITSPTTATAQITVLSTSPVGFAPLTMTTDGEVTTLQQAIDIEEGFPKILATSPAGGEQGNNITLQVLGRFANWQQGVTSAAFNSDITVNTVNVIDSNNLQLGITVSPWAYVDYYPWLSCGHVLTITTGTEQVAGAGGPSGTPGIFCVQQGPKRSPALRRLRPTRDRPRP